MKPPRFAVYLLTRFASSDEALVGDLVERFRQRPSRSWFWRQALVVACPSLALLAGLWAVQPHVALCVEG